MVKEIILASKSEVRRKILEENGIKCIVEPPNIDENLIKESLLKENVTSELISKNLAELKANKVSQKKSEKLVLGADSIIDLEGEIISKPLNRNDAFNILKKCAKDKSNLIFLSSSRVYAIKKLLELKKNKFLINENFDTSGAKSIYGFCKHSSEHLIKEFSFLYKTKYIITRFGLIAGPWQFGKQDQGVVSLWVWKHMNKKKLSYMGFGGKGSQIRDIIHISDVCKLIALQIKKINSIYNITMNAGGGKENAISLRDLTKICQKITLNRIKISSKRSTSEYDIPYYVTDNSKVKKIYKWNPKKKILHIIQDMYKWMLSNKKILKKYIK